MTSRTTARNSSSGSGALTIVVALGGSPTAERSGALGAVEACRQLLDELVGRWISGQTEERPQPAGRAQRAHELALARRQARREVQHDVADLPQRGRFARQCGGGGEREVLVVVEPRRAGTELGVEARDRRGRIPGSRELFDRVAAGGPQLEERRVERPFGGGVTRDRRQRRPGVGEHGPHGLGPEGAREGPPPLLGQRRRAEQLGQPGQREEPHVDEPVGPGELTTERQTRVRRRDDHRDRRQRVRALRLPDRLAQYLARRRTVLDELHPNHPPEGTDGV